MDAKLDRLIIRRSQPVQGQQVTALVDWNGRFVGELNLPFGAWLKFKRLLEKGIEGDARENYALQIRLSIQGIPETEPAIRPEPRIPNAVVQNQTNPSLIARADEPDDDPDIRAAEQAAAEEIRTARRS